VRCYDHQIGGQKEQVGPIATRGALHNWEILVICSPVPALGAALLEKNDHTEPAYFLCDFQW
jgi:hypothetical protein